MFHRITFLLLLRLLPLLSVAPAGAETGHTLRVDTMSHAVRLSLTVPRSIYPRGGITRVTVRVENLSRQPLIVTPGCAFQFDNPQIESLTPSGVIRYPPAVRSATANPSPPCTGGAVRSGVLRSGAYSQWSVLALLGASRLRATVALAPLEPNNRVGRSFTVVGRTVPVRLLGMPGTRIVRCSNSYSCLHVLPPPGARVTGPLYYAYSAKCEDANGNVAYGQQLLLTPTTRTTLHIGCGAPLVELHLVAGWLNQPVGRIDTAIHQVSRITS